jgi:hypothetical protein
MSERVEERQSRASDIVGMVFYSILGPCSCYCGPTFRPDVTAGTRRGCHGRRGSPST